MRRRFAVGVLFGIDRIMYMIPDDDYDTGIRHAMLHADLSQIYDMSKGKRNFQLPDEDIQKIVRKYQRLGDRQTISECIRSSLLIAHVRHGLSLRMHSRSNF